MNQKEHLKITISGEVDFARNYLPLVVKYRPCCVICSWNNGGMVVTSAHVNMVNRYRSPRVVTFDMVVRFDSCFFFSSITAAFGAFFGVNLNL